MPSSAKSRILSEKSDTVGLVIALLVRFPELATIVSHHADGTLTLSFAVAERIERDAGRALREHLADHVRSLVELGGEALDVLAIECESDAGTSFVRITRDVRTFGREELQLLVAVLHDRFGARLHKSPTADDDAFDGDGDDLVDYALESLRDPTQQRSLVGFREEKRVLVYFVKSRKKAKARARS